MRIIKRIGSGTRFVIASAMKIWVENRLQETKREIEELEGRAGVLKQIDNAVDNMFCKSTEDFARAHRDEERPDGSTLH